MLISYWAVYESCLAKLRVCRPNRVLPRLLLDFAFIGQAIELSLLKEVIYGGLPPIDRLNQAQQLEPMEILSKAGVVWSSEGLFTYLNSFLV